MTEPPTPAAPGADAGRCVIRVKGRLGAHWSTWFDGFTVTAEADGTTLITGAVVDQAALFGLLQTLRDLGLPLLSVDRIEPDGRHRPAAGPR